VTDGPTGTDRDPAQSPDPAHSDGSRPDLADSGHDPSSHEIMAPIQDQPGAAQYDAAGTAWRVADQALQNAPDPPLAVSETFVPGPAGSTPPVAGMPGTTPLREPDEAALRLAEAVVFASVTPMTARALSQLLPDDMDAAAVIAALRLRYEGKGIELVETGGGLRFRTAADLAPLLRKVVQVPRRLPRVALETLAIVAYHQPITRPEIEDMRGAGLSQQTLDVLLENDLIVARGRKETPGRPTLWGTTPKFLEYFGLRDIRELPRRQDLLLEAVRPETDGDTGPVASGRCPETREEALPPRPPSKGEAL
jgi:segregation and condensation protein B